jgi:SAM-dependent methyltransferase
MTFRDLISKVLNKINRDGIVETLLSIVRYPIKSRKLKKYNKMLQLKTPKERFTEIYRQNFWSSSESGSGEGSEFLYTKTLRSELPRIVEKYSIKTIVDAPCGDFNWMCHVLPKISVHYIGVDIVDNVIVRNRHKYEAVDIHFAVADICSDQLPECDLLIVRDCLFHLSYSDINRFLRNIAQVDYKYLLTTTYVNDSKEEFENHDIATGAFRRIDLITGPFEFNPTNILYSVNDHVGDHLPRIMVLFAKESVPNRLAL